MFFSEFLWKPPSPFVSFPLFLFLFLFSHSSLCPAPSRPAPVYKSRMYTALLLELRLSVQVSAGEIDFGLFPKDLNIISPWQGRSVAQARLVHGGPTTGNLSTRTHPPADTPPANNHPWTSTHAEDSRPPRNTNGTYTQKRPEDHRTRHRRICASPARQRR